MLSKKEFAIVSKLSFISMKIFMLSWVEHEKFYNLRAWIQQEREMRSFIVSLGLLDTKYIDEQMFWSDFVNCLHVP